MFPNLGLKSLHGARRDSPIFLILLLADSHARVLAWAQLRLISWG